MQTNLRNCLCCEQEFHPITHIPRILPTCGHTFCTQCLNIILNGGRICPFDLEPTPDVQVKDLQINTTVLAALPRLLPFQDLCPRHQKPQDLICLSEYQKRCIDCKEECLYRRHNIRILRDVEGEADEKKRVLQSFAEDFDSEYEIIDTLLHEQEEALLKEVDSHFEIFQAEIEKTKNHIRSAVKRYFEVQRKIADESYNHDIQLKNQANHLIKTLNEKTFNQGFFNALRTHIGGLVISSQKPRIAAAINVLDNHTEAIRIELMAFLDRIPTLLKTKDHTDDLKVEENGVTGSLNSMQNHSIEEDEMEEEIMPRVETEEDYLKAISLFYAEIKEDNRLVLSFKNQQIDTENPLNDREKLKTINKVTLNLNKSKEWKEAIECLQWIWNKLGKVQDLKIDLSFKTHAKEIIEALSEQNDIWATTDLLEFTLDLSSSRVEDKHVIQLYEKAIWKMSNVERLEIVLEKTRITNTSVKEFAENTLPNLASLTDFRLYVDYTKVSDDALEKLLTGLHKRKRNLTGLALGFDDTAVTDKTIENIAQSISPLAIGLRKFDLSANNIHVSDDGLKILSEAFDSQLSKLKEFTLDLGCTKVSNEGLKFFVQSTLPKMISLEVFELFLNEQKKITNKIIKPLAKSLHPLMNLKKICLELGGTEINGKTLVALEQSTLKNKPALETFELYVAETQIKDIDINHFFTKIGEDQTFQNLQKLSFCFSQLNVTDKSCELLAKAIQPCMNNLQILHLQLGKTKIADLGLISLSNGLHQTLQKTKLTELQLYLDSTEITDKGLKIFSNEVVRSLVGINSFELYLTLLKGVTDQGVEALFTELSTVVGSLRKIDISLYETRVTDGCMKALSKTLWSVKPNFESFALSIGKNKNITDESLEWCLCNFAPILHNLKSLMLNIEGTKISEKGVRLLRQYLQKVPSALEKLEIEVGEDRNLQKIVQDLENHLV